MSNITTAVGWPSTGVIFREWDWADVVERRKERGERREERYSNLLSIKKVGWELEVKIRNWEGGCKKLAVGSILLPTANC